jgi:hypothetical protein
MTSTRTREEADDIDGERKFYVFDLNTQEELHAQDTLNEQVLDHDDKNSHIIIIDDDEPPRPRPRPPAPPLWSVDAYEAGTCMITFSHPILTYLAHTRELVPVHQVRPVARATSVSLTPRSHACVPNMKVFSVVWDNVAAVRPIRACFPRTLTRRAGPDPVPRVRYDQAGGRESRAHDRLLSRGPIPRE